MNKHSADTSKYNIFKLSLMLFALCGLTVFSGSAKTSQAAEQTAEVFMVKPYDAGAKAPLYPAFKSEDTQVIYADKNKSYKVEEIISDDFIIKMNGTKYIAGSDYFALSFLLDDGRKKTGEVSFNQPSESEKFENIKLPEDIEKSEYFFNSADKKSFYTLAFILYLKNGGNFNQYPEMLKKFDDLILKQKAKNGINANILESLNEFLKEINIKSRYITGKKINPLILKQALLFSKAVVLQSLTANTRGDIYVFYNLKNISKKRLIYEYYNYNDGTGTINGLEILPVLVNSNPQYLIIF